MSVFRFLVSKAFFKHLGMALASAIVLFFIVKIWLYITTNHNQKIGVPNLSRLTVDQVEKQLNNLDLKYVVLDSANYNPDYPKKSVIEQNPEGGDFVKEGRKIYLTLNPSRYRDIKVPDLNGRTKRQAISELTAIGFKISETFTYKRDIGKDVVRGLKHNGRIINPEEKLPKNSIIELILGDGKR